MKKFYFLIVALCMVSIAKAQIINFPDANFKAKLLMSSPSQMIAQGASQGQYIKIDANNDGEIDVNEAVVVTYLNINASNVASLNGIENFINLRRFECNNNLISSLNPINTLVNLQRLYCANNQLTTLNVSLFPNLIDLRCNDNQISNLNTSGLNQLWEFNCGNNQLSTLPVNHLTSLRVLDCRANLLTSIDINSLVNLTSFGCASNSLTFLDVSNLINLQFVNCSFNQISTLDFSNCPLFKRISCINNPPLTSLFVKNGSLEEMMFCHIDNNPNLVYICADEDQLLDFQNKINQNAYTNCHVNSYCTFVPGETFYRIFGSTKLDENNDGCNVTDSSVPNLKLNITNGITSGALVPNASGEYSIPVVAGTHTITPQFPNQNYFTITPPSVTVTFPGTSGFLIQDFCIVPNVVNPDLEIAIVPLTVARPGFDTHYKIIYKNNGSSATSGTLNFAFNEDVLDLISLNPMSDSQTTNTLSWIFSDLMPFETREISLTFNLNSPTETPAVNSGFLLEFNSVLESVLTDSSLADNFFTLNQTVVNSYDPNDKTCLEGTTISPSEVGKYVHYVIRFENTGTYPAENIVVKDMIDTNKLDINSLVPIKGSHDFFTRINGNKVEFIFENINLPFDDANNDGYVAFKIKTKPTLVVGNTFSNSASIYFDYNFPIVTNTATTAIQTLSTQDFEFGQYLSLYPNPVNNELNIETKQTIEVSSISIYNTLGQLVVVVPNAKNITKIDVSSLSSGNYFVKINSDKGTANTKFIKN